MNSTKTIKVTEEFHQRPKGRYATDAPGCELTAGEVFRKKYLVKALREYDTVIVDLSGYNRYGRSFLDEAFGGLISRENFTKAELDKKLTVKHDLVELFVQIAYERIEAAEERRPK
ncbi:STAS-like domain-containing protein [Vibrio cholerae]|uniref:STAS-like domain-containing protein n=1 Tax=Vibrio cholerae TaxID=666 RepID=UPI00156041BE|nr:STAS-like domain-containing protein [Vibrio cholerae]NOF82407.1 STAS-like domain-containing protein [Vibrio cholerae]